MQLKAIKELNEASWIMISPHSQLIFVLHCSCNFVYIIVATADVWNTS